MKLGVIQSAILVTFVGAIVITIGSFILEVDTVVYEPPIDSSEIEGLETSELEQLIGSREKDIGYVNYLIFALGIPEMRTSGLEVVRIVGLLTFSRGIISLVGKAIDT